MTCSVPALLIANEVLVSETALSSSSVPCWIVHGMASMDEPVRVQAPRPVFSNLPKP
ncbi:hypothetical protein D3C86_2076010 [compost metagenome]